jgi:hypothetical protein
MRARVLVVAAVLGILARPVHGQAVAGQPIARVDVAVFTGSFSADTTELAIVDEEPSYDRWVHMAVFEATAGYYWTDHLKTEVQALWTTEGESSGSELVALPGGPAGWLYHTNRYTARQFGVGQIWQFGRNAMFHPWIGAGVDFVHIDHELDRPAQFFYGSQPGIPAGPPIPIPALVLQTATDRTLPFAATGFKAYFGERGFFRTDLKLQFKGGVEQVVWKVGAGVDF